jgi:hypothetical protein
MERSPAELRDHRRRYDGTPAELMRSPAVVIRCPAELMDPRQCRRQANKNIRLPLVLF